MPVDVASAVFVSTRITSFFTGSSESLSIFPSTPGIARFARARSSGVRSTSAIDATFAPMPTVVIIR